MLSNMQYNMEHSNISTPPAVVIIKDNKTQRAQFIACPLTLFEATSESTLLADHKVTFFTFESQSVETSKPTKL